MRKRLLGLATAVAFGGPAAAEDLITEPVWAQRPPAEILRLYHSGDETAPWIAGSATVECAARPEGRLEKCHAISESVPGHRFGDMAEYVAQRLYRLMPGAGKRRVRFSIDFPLPPFDTPPKKLGDLSPASLAAVWPVAAHGGEGSAVITCLVTVQAVIRNCRTVAEDPPGQGFGAAAIQIAPNVVYRPATKAGRPIDAPMVLSVSWKGEGPTGPGVRIMTNFWWEATPSPADVGRVYPKSALEKGLEGNAVIRCEITLEGRLQHCSALSDAPARNGFADAALKLAPLFRSVSLDSIMDPKLIPSVRVDIPVHFSPQTSPAQPRRITKPQWTRQPDPQSVYAAYPPRAADAHVETGRGVVDCAVGAHGELADCRTVSEQPADLDFGKAAAAIAQQMAVSPWTEDGAPAEGARITLPIRFVHKEPGPAPESAPKSP